MLEIEGKWEDILAISPQLNGRRVKLIVLPTLSVSELDDEVPSFQAGKGGSILDYAGRWSGDDLEDCLQLVYNTRSQIEE